MKLTKKRKILVAVLAAAMVSCVVGAGCQSAVKGYKDPGVSSTLTDLNNKNVSGAQYYGNLEKVAENYASEYIMSRHKPMAGSFYAYTEGVTDDLAGVEGSEGNEGVFWPGSQLVKISLTDDSETVLIDSPDGVVRDPDVSPDGTKVVFSWKTSRTKDDYHLYIYDLEEGDYQQITFGQGISDIEPKWLPNGKIVFSSSRAIQIVDCWKTPVSNLYVCNADGSDMIRVGYDQVHTTYPTVTEDGRVLYTRWDYNDRTQMFVQALFQMNPDGTNQTAVFGNNSNNPTTVMHTVEVPGASSKYLTIVSGHHVVQGGKLAWIDTAVERDGKSPLTYVREKAESGESIDTLGQAGTIYKFPVALNEYEMFYSKAPSWASSKQETKFDLYYYNARTGEETKVADGSKIACSQISPIRTRKLFNRPSMVNYNTNVGTYYVANVYEGDPVAGVKKGDIKYLRVVALGYRPYAIGSVSAGNSDAYPNGYGTSDPSTPVGVANSTWDVKKVIGIVPVEADGSVMFSCPSDEPVYFQLLDKDGLMIQSMRSWSTLMPGETFSCVGCHESKNSVPNNGGTVTLAMKKGVQKLQKDLWMTTPEYDNYDPYKDFKGFSYSNEIQPILDQSCIACHTDVEEANRRLGSSGSSQDIGSPVIDNGWKYTVTTKSVSVGDWQSADFNPDWTESLQPFGSDSSSSVKWGASEDACFYMTKKFTLTSLEGTFYINWQYDEDAVLYLNGTLIQTGNSYVTGTRSFELSSSHKALLKVGENVLTARAYNATGGSYMFVQLTNKNGSTGAPVEKAVALTSDLRTASRDKVDYYLSYLVLTDAFLKGGSYYVGRPTNNITNWIGGMSEPQMIDAYQYGSTKSGIIDKLMNGHKGVQLAKEDIMRIAAWIDLGVPFRGAYNEASSNWNSKAMGEAERRQNMRDYYTTIDKLNKAKLAGKFTNKKVTIEYYDRDDNFIGAAESKHLTTLYLDQKIQPGDKVVVTLPKGSNYIWFNLTPKMKISLQYCPDGTFTYIVPEYAALVLPKLTVDATSGQNNQYVYTHPTITAFLPSDEDLSALYNVALNPYDMPYKNEGARITAGSTWENDGYGNFMPANAFDGFTTNRSHANNDVPDQSWGPDKNANPADIWLKVDFGREVELSYFNLYIRADFPHDAYITELTLEFSDGSTVTYKDLQETNQAQKLTLENKVKTTSVKIKDIKTSKADWFAISEFECYGTNVIK